MLSQIQIQCSVERVIIVMENPLLVFPQFKSLSSYLFTDSSQGLEIVRRLISIHENASLLELYFLKITTIHFMSFISVCLGSVLFPK